MKLHIMGFPGAGKTALARSLAELWGISPTHLDLLVYEPGAIAERPRRDIDRDIAQVMTNGAWVTEGDYDGDWLRPVLDAADVIVWLDFPWIVCATRMLKRQVRRTRTTGRYHRGWRHLAWLLAHTLRARKRRVASTQRFLTPYQTKLTLCRSGADIANLKRRLELVPNDPC